MKKLVHFTAEWCQPCKRMQPVIEEFKNENPGIEYVKVDIDSNRDLFDDYTKLQSVMSVPTFFAVENGELYNSKTGVMTKQELAGLFV
jgi:thioredoxin 1